MPLVVKAGGGNLEIGRTWQQSVGDAFVARASHELGGGAGSLKAMAGIVISEFG
jgi:hypothetical protein